MTKQRRKFTARFKTRVALEAIKGTRTIQEIASHFQVHTSQVAKWKRVALERMPESFSTGPAQNHEREDNLKAQLFQQIGEMKVELDWLKKKSGFET